MTESTVTILDWLSENSTRLQGITETPLNDVRVLLSDHLNINPTWLASHPDEIMSLASLIGLEEKMEQLISGFPLPYILKHWEFYGLDFYVTPDVLIPRPETEVLVEHGLDWLANHPEIHTGFDIGTGSGNIAISLAWHDPSLQMTAADRSEAALAVAQINVDRHKLSDRLQLTKSNLMESIPTTEIHFLCANLPYIPREDLINLQVAQYEPIIALDGGLDGLDYYRALLQQVSPRLSPPFCLLLEMEYRQSEALTMIIKDSLPETDIRIIPDLAGLLRIMMITGGDNHVGHQA